MNPEHEHLEVSVVEIDVEESVHRIVSRQDELNKMLDSSVGMVQFALSLGYPPEEILASQTTVLMSHIGKDRNAEMIVGLLVTATARLAGMKQ